MSEQVDEIIVTDEEVEAARQELIRIRLLEIQDAARADMIELQSELKRRQWRDNGPLWAQERLGDFLWSTQRRIMQAMREHRKVLVQSCHDIGKSFIAAEIASWWLDVYPPGEAFVVTTAPTTAQVKAILWREIGRCHTRGDLQGRVNQAEWYMRPVEGKREEIVAFGRKPDEYDPAAFQGIHSQNVLVIIDEANGVRGPLHDAAGSLIANDSGKILMIGNPDDPSGEFYEAAKPGTDWVVIKVSAFDSPNFTAEDVPRRVKSSLIGRTYVEERRKRWAPNWTWGRPCPACSATDGRHPSPTTNTIEPGTTGEGEASPEAESAATVCLSCRGTFVVETNRCFPPVGAKPEDTHPFWQSKILGEFPLTPQGVHQLIPLPWIRAAQERTLTVRDSEPIRLGCDVGGGGDSSTISMAKAGFVRIVRDDRNPDTMQTCQNCIDALDSLHGVEIRVDEIGIGRGVVDRGKELQKPFIGINVGRAAFEPDRFINLRAQFWWYVRGLFELGQVDIDPEDEDLAAELASLRYKTGDRGKISMESKDEARRRGVASPNRADALMLALAELSLAGTISQSEISGFAGANDGLTRESAWSPTTSTTPPGMKPTGGHES